jgi:SagB-type dehydrogenase family enzyme
MRLIDRVHPDPAQAVAATAQPTVANARGCIVLTATFSRSASKYGERAYKHAFLEAGSVMQNIGLVGEALHIDTMSVGVCADEYLEPLLGIDGTDETALHTIFFG